MRPTGRAIAAAALAVAISCGGSLPPPAAQPAATLPVSPPERAAAAGGAPQTASSGTASIAGTVAHAVDGRPLSRARVILVSPALTERRVAITGADGRFEFRNLPAGAYSVSASRTGFAAHHFPDPGASSAAAVSIASGQNLSSADIALAPAGVIAGQILDEDSQPFAGARVHAVAPRAGGAQPSLDTIATDVTDDRGNFRLIGLPAGEYYVSALDSAFAGAGGDTAGLAFAPTYYPGTPFPDSARRIVVAAGAEATEKVVFTLKIVRPARVTGLLATPDKRPLISGTVVMNPVDAEAPGAAPARDVIIRPDGTFEFRNVPPGRYQIRARGEVEPHGTASFATFAVAVSGSDVTGLALTLTPGATLAGSLVVEAISAQRIPFAGLRVRAPFPDGSSFGDALTGDVAADGTYRIRGLMPGSHVITVEGLPHPWVLKSVIHRGRDITDTGLDVEGRGQFDDVRVIVTDAWTEVSGTVHDAAGREAADAVVLVIPTEPRFWTDTSRRFGVQRTDGTGRYRIRGLPAGEYRAIATYAVHERDVRRRELLPEVVRQGSPLSLTLRERRTLDLPIVSLAARRTVSR